MLATFLILGMLFLTGLVLCYYLGEAVEGVSTWSKGFWRGRA